MNLNHSALENDFDCACQDVIKTLSSRYVSEYEGGGPGKLEAFFDLIKTEFERVESEFIKKHNITGENGILKGIRSIAKSYAKKCIDQYSRIRL